jgi:ABC-type polar amino acid transport system ATPase subunit
MRPEEMRETEKVLNVMRDLTDGGASCMIVTH